MIVLLGPVPIAPLRLTVLTKSALPPAEGAVVQGTVRSPRRRTGRDPAAFRPFELLISRMNMRRKAQGMRLP